MNAPQQTASYSIASSTQAMRADNLNTLILRGCIGGSYPVLLL
jgi:hypothetical protein